MRRVAVVLALAVVAALLLLSKRGGLGGRADRATTAPAEQTRTPGPAATTGAGSTASEAPKAQAWQAVGAVNAARGSVEIVIWWDVGCDRRIAYGPIIDGRFAIDLPVLAEMPAFLRRGAGLIARASAQGFVSGESLRVPLADKEPGEVPLDVKLEPGVAVRGRVIDETGRAVADAEVWLCPNDGEPGDDEVEDETDAVGAFDLPLREAGT